MTGISYKNWQVLSDEAIGRTIGAFIRKQRLEQNKTQASVAAAANISRSTLSLLERGETVTLATLIQVLRVLDLLYVFQEFEIKQQLSPLLLAEMEQKKMKRARPKKKVTSKKLKKSDW